MDPERYFAGACGIDEAGRGPLAGPVCAAAVCLPADFPFRLLDDSKRLSERKRLLALEAIRAKARFGVGWASPAEIDELNILWATMLAMRRAFDAARAMDCAVPMARRAVVDGNRSPELDAPCEAIVRGDALVYEIMAASIVAKTSRDAEMERYARLYPEYGYERHKGYPTAEHRRICRELGPSPIQRKSFKY